MRFQTGRTYSQRSETHPNALIRRLLLLADKKKSNLVVSADVETTAEILKLADIVGPHIVMLKTHIDIISDFTPSTITSLQVLSVQHEFLIFEDRKYVDIGNTVQKQYVGGTHKTASWAHVVDAVLLPGPGVIAGLHAGLKSSEVLSKLEAERGVLLLTEMTSAGALKSFAYAEMCLQTALEWPEFVMGFIGPRSLNGNNETLVEPDKDFVMFTTGISLESGGDTLGQQYQTPRSAVAQGADFLIVGRGVYASIEPAREAKRYQCACWEAHLDRLSL